MARKSSWNLRVKVCVRVRQDRVLHVLLGDRRAALGRATGDVVVGRPDDAGEGDARVGVEAAVLRGQHGVRAGLRDLRQRDVGAVLVAEPGHLRRAVGVVDDGGLRGGDRVGARHVGAGVDDADEHAEQHEHPGEERRGDLQPALRRCFLVRGSLPLRPRPRLRRPAAATRAPPGGRPPADAPTLPRRRPAATPSCAPGRRVGPDDRRRSRPPPPPVGRAARRGRTADRSGARRDG